MTHALTFLAGIVTAIGLVWGWVGSELSHMGEDAGWTEDEQ